MVSLWMAPQFAEPAGWTSSTSLCNERRLSRTACCWHALAFLSAVLAHIMSMTCRQDVHTARVRPASSCEMQLLGSQRVFSTRSSFMDLARRVWSKAAVQHRIPFWK